MYGNRVRVSVFEAGRFVRHAVVTWLNGCLRLLIVCCQSRYRLWLCGVPQIGRFAAIAWARRVALPHYPTEIPRHYTRICGECIVYKICHVLPATPLSDARNPLRWQIFSRLDFSCSRGMVSLDRVISAPPVITSTFFGPYFCSVYLRGGGLYGGVIYGRGR